MSATERMRDLLSAAKNKNLLVELVKFGTDWRSNQKATGSFFDERARETEDNCSDFNHEHAVVHKHSGVQYNAIEMDYGRTNCVTLANADGGTIKPSMSAFEDLYWFDNGDIGRMQSWLDKQVEKTDSKPEKESNTMSNNKSLTTAAMAANKSAIKTAAVIAVGQAGNATAKKAIVPVLPMMVRGYADSMFGDVIIANMVNLAVTQFAPDNEKAIAVSQAMIDASMLEVLGKIDIPNLIDKLTAGIDTNKLSQLMNKDSDAE